MQTTCEKSILYLQGKDSKEVGFSKHILNASLLFRRMFEGKFYSVILLI